MATLIRLSDDDIEQFQNRLGRNRVPFSSITLRYLLSEEEKARVAVNSHQLAGVAIESQFVRSYPLGSLTAHSLGYVSEINREEMNALTDAQKKIMEALTISGKVASRERTRNCCTVPWAMKSLRKITGARSCGDWTVRTLSPGRI